MLANLRPELTPEQRGRLVRCLELHRFGTMLFMLAVSVSVAVTVTGGSLGLWLQVLLLVVPALLGAAASWGMRGMGPDGRYIWVSLLFLGLGAGVSVYGGSLWIMLPFLGISAGATLSGAERLATRLGIDVKGRGGALLGIPVTLSVASAFALGKGIPGMQYLCAATFLLTFLLMTVAYSLALGRLARGLEAPDPSDEDEGNFTSL